MRPVEQSGVVLVTSEFFFIITCQHFSTFDSDSSEGLVGSGQKEGEREAEIEELSNSQIKPGGRGMQSRAPLPASLVIVCRPGHLWEKSRRIQSYGSQG